MATQDEGNGTLELQLANGKSVMGRGHELACFLASGGSSIVPLPKRKGGKSKGAKRKRKPQKVA